MVVTTNLVYKGLVLKGRGDMIVGPVGMKVLVTDVGPLAQE